GRLGIATGQDNGPGGLAALKHPRPRPLEILIGTRVQPRIVESGAERCRLVYSWRHEASGGCPSERLITIRRGEAGARNSEDAKGQRQPCHRGTHRNRSYGKGF